MSDVILCISYSLGEEFIYKKGNDVKKMMSVAHEIKSRWKGHAGGVKIVIWK